MRFMKRKSTSYDGIQVPSRKQLITEEKMAACMQRLSLNQGDNPTPSSSGSKSRSDDSDFEDCDENQAEYDLQYQADKKLPVIEFAPGMKESLPNINPILPESILEKLVSKPCLAVVPYVPPADMALQMIMGMKDDSTQRDEKDDNMNNSVNEEEMKESFSVDWDSDCDDDFQLD